MSASAIYLTIVCCVMGAIFIFGLLSSRNIKDAEDWAVAGRGLGIIPLSGTYFATIVSATSIVSYMGYYYYLQKITLDIYIYVIIKTIYLIN